MKRKILGLIVGFLFIGINVFAADGDLTVDGNVGIGTTEPTAKLHIKTGTDQNIKFSAFVNSVNGTALTASNDNGANKNDFEIIANNIILTPTGNVGIGTTNPGSTMSGQQSPILDVVDSNNGQSHTWIRIAGREDLARQKVIGIWMHPSQIGNAGWYMGTDNTGNLLHFSYGAGTSEYLAAAAAKDGLSGITINTSGNVGIGTVSPSYKLDLAGAFRLNSDGGGNSLVISAYNDSVTRIDSTGDINLQREVSLMLAGADNYHNTYIWNGKTSELSIVASFIGSSGNVGIGTTDPGGYRLYVAGTAYSTGGWQSSDIRFKDNIRSIESPMNKILNIEGISFDWKKDEFKDKGFPEGRHYGVIAQRVEKVLPEVVREGPGGDKSVSYTELIPVLIEAIKEQQREIGELRAEINELRSSIHKDVASLQR